MTDFSIDVKLNQQQAVAAARALGRQFGNTADDMEDLVDVGRDLDKSIDDIARDLAKVSGRPFEEVRQEVRQAAAAIDKLGNSAREAGNDAKKGMSKASEGVSEFKNEAQSSGREAAASFGGGFDDVADFVQETLANALAGFGPIGAAAGLALAAVMGTALAGAQEAQEKLQAARERAGELAALLYQNGGKLPMTERVEELFTKLAEEAGSGNPLLNLIDGWTDFGSTLDAVKTASRLTGVEVRSLLSAMSGDDLTQSQALLAGINEKIKELESNVSTGWAWDENLRGLREVRDETEKNIAAQKLGAEIIKETGAADVKASEERAEAARTHADEIRSRIAEISGAWQNAATDAADYFITTEEGATSFDWSAYLANAEATIAAADEYKRRITTLPPEIAAEAERIFAERGAVDANAYTAAYEGASEADRGRFSAAAAANGAAAGDSAARNFIDAANAGQAGWKPRDFTSTIAVRLDTSEWDNWTPRMKQGYIRANKLDTLE